MVVVLDEEAVAYGLGEGRVVWFDNLKRDWWFNLRNSHDLLSVVLCHRLHPVGSCIRLAILIFALGMSCFSASLVLMLNASCKDTKQTHQSEAECRADRKRGWFSWLACMGV